MLGTPIPWFAGSKGKGLSWASQPHPYPPPQSRAPLQGKVPGQVASPLRLNIHIYGMTDPSLLCSDWEESLQESSRRASH